MNIISRRSFLSHTAALGLGTALASLTDIPFVMQRALAEGNIGLPDPNGRVKKLLFIFLRGANDGLNSVIPFGDDAYAPPNRQDILIGKDPAQPFTAQGPALFPTSGPTAGTYDYASGLPLGNGFAALHPALKFLAPVYNAGDLALIHRVGYPKQSRSHFDSQNYWETGTPNSNLVKDGILYRAMIESGLANTSPLTGVSIGSSLPLILRGSKAAMTNLNDPTRYNLLAVPNTPQGNAKADAALAAANQARFADKREREFLALQYQNLASTLDTFAHLDFSESGNTFVDDEATDGDQPYYLFPTTNAKNGGYVRNNNPLKYVVPTSSYQHFQNLKAAATVLNKTSALVAGVSIDGWDTHSNQGAATGSQANLLRRVGWSMYALRKFFSNPQYADKCRWDDLVVVTLSEFGRTTIENSDNGTDHAEASVMFVAGGGVKGFQAGALGGVQRTGVFNCGGDNDPIKWQTGQNGTMFQSTGRYLKRATDYRSVLGKLIRDHLGATQPQLDRIIPGYASSKESLKTRGIQTKDNTEVNGEPDIV
jgi:uncharacterized protein (DUF1501 family)